MDAEVLRLQAHIDQSRSELRAAVKTCSSDELTKLIKTCARGQLDDLDERQRLLVGMLAVVAIFNLLEDAGEEG